MAALKISDIKLRVGNCYLLKENWTEITTLVQKLRNQSTVLIEVGKILVAN